MAAKSFFFTDEYVQEMLQCNLVLVKKTHTFALHLHYDCGLLGCDAVCLKNGSLP
jgi:hypothetical protein